MAGATCWRPPISFSRPGSCVSLSPRALARLALAWALIGIGMGFGLYEAAFATAAGLYGREARNAITGITLFAGFASTVGWPASALFIEHFGWRGACVAWAVLHLVIGLPMNRLLIPKAQPHAAEVTPEHEVPSGIPWTMIVLAAVFGATWFVSTALAAHLPRLLEAMGAAPAMAIFAASLVGPAQVAARMVEFTLLRNLSPMISARLATGLHPIGAVLLAIFGPVAAVPFVLLHGAGNGMLTIARGTVPLALFGPAGYGLRTGILSAPARILQGGAPLLVRSRARSGRAAHGPAALRRAHRSVVPRTVHPECRGAGLEGRGESRIAHRLALSLIFLPNWKYGIIGSRHGFCCAFAGCAAQPHAPADGGRPDRHGRRRACEPPRAAGLDHLLSSRGAGTGRAHAIDPAGPADHPCGAHRGPAAAARLSHRDLLRRPPRTVRRSRDACFPHGQKRIRA